MLFPIVLIPCLKAFRSQYPSSACPRTGFWASSCISTTTISAKVNTPGCHVARNVFFSFTQRGKIFGISGSSALTGGLPLFMTGIFQYDLRETRSLPCTKYRGSPFLSSASATTAAITEPTNPIPCTTTIFLLLFLSSSESFFRISNSILSSSGVGNENTVPSGATDTDMYPPKISS